jgi:hypothetical protein
VRQASNWRCMCSRHRTSGGNIGKSQLRHPNAPIRRRFKPSESGPTPLTRLDPLAELRKPAAHWGHLPRAALNFSAPEILAYSNTVTDNRPRRRRLTNLCLSGCFSRAPHVVAISSIERLWLVVC